MRQTKNWFFILASLKKQVDMLRIFLAISLIAGAFGGQAVAAEFIDYGTSHQFMVPFADSSKGPLALHICGGNTFMIGVHVKDNKFACEDSFPFLYADGGDKFFYSIRYQSPAEIIPNAQRGSVQRYESHGMAACPPGTAMIGLHAARNVLACAPFSSTNPSDSMWALDLFVDAHTYRNVGGERLHTCPLGSVMVGIHDARDLLLCGSRSGFSGLLGPAEVR